MSFLQLNWVFVQKIPENFQNWKNSAEEKILIIKNNFNLLKCIFEKVGRWDK